MFDLQSELNALEAELKNLLKSELGKFSSGQVAIWKGALKPIELKTTGLECTIYPVKEGETVKMSAGQTLADQYWRVELVNFCTDLRDPAFGRLAIAKMKIERHFKLCGAPLYQQPTDRRLERCVFKIYAPTVYNPA